MEWQEDYEEAEPGHRHISHLWALHPAYQITPVGEPELCKAARVTLQRRLESGGGQTGWSRADSQYVCETLGRRALLQKFTGIVKEIHTA